MGEEAFEIYLDLLKIQNVRIYLAQFPYPDFGKMDYHFRGSIYHDFNYDALRESIAVALTPHTILCFQDRFKAEYMAFSLQDTKVENQAKFVVVGPFRYRAYSIEELKKLSCEIGLNEEGAYQLEAHLNRMEWIRDRSSWISTNLVILNRLLSHGCEWKIHRTESLPEVAGSCRSDLVMPTKNLSLDNGFAYQIRLIEAVRAGEVGEACHGIMGLARFQEGFYERYYNISHAELALEINYLLKAFLFQNGIHVSILDEVYIRYRKIIRDIGRRGSQAIPYIEMASDYCAIAKKYNYSRRGYNQLTQKCLYYIDTYYCENISLKQLAKEFAVTPQYLSMVFNKETGTTLVNRINTVRVERAKVLLSQSNLSIQEISGQVGFSDASYFSRAFTKYADISPRAYRNRCLEKNS